MGPCGPIVVFNVGTPTLWTNAKFDAFPSEAIHTFQPTHKTTRAVTWERKDLAVNRNVAATWAYCEPLRQTRAVQAGGAAPMGAEPVELAVRYGDVCDKNPALLLRGMVVRVSAWDPWGLAVPPVKGPERLNQARVCDYEPLG